MSRLPFSFGVLATIVITSYLLVALIASGKVPLRYNVRNAAVRWLTTLLTLVVFTLVTLVLTVMLAFVNGMRQLTENSGHPDNVVVLSEGATDEAFSNLGYSDTGDLGSMLDDANRERLLTDEDGWPLVTRQKYVVVGQPLGKPTADGQQPRRSFMQVRGIEDPLVAAAVHRLELLSGQWWVDGVRALPGNEKEAALRTLGQALSAGMQRLGGGLGHPLVIVPPHTSDDVTAVETVLGEGVARTIGKAYGKETLAVGDVFELGPRQWVVVGIMKSAGSTFGSEVWADSALVGDMFGKKVFTSLVVRTRGPEEAEKVAAALSDRKVLQRAAFAAVTERKYYASLGATNQQFASAIWCVAFFVGLGGVFGVMNTMFAAVSQRLKDIGVMRIIGFARWQILVSFFLESLGIALLGGLLGLGLGSLFHGVSATSIASSGQGGGKSIMLTMTVDVNTVVIVLLFSLILGALGGLVPSLSAMRQRPLEAVR